VALATKDATYRLLIKVLYLQGVAPAPHQKLSFWTSRNF